MSDADMRGIVAQARLQYENLPPEQRDQMIRLLQRGIPGVQHALNEIMLAEFSSASG